MKTQKGGKGHPARLDTSLVSNHEDTLWGILRGLAYDARFALSTEQFERILVAIKARDVRFVVDELPNVSSSFLQSGDTAQAAVVYQLSAFLKKYPFKEGYTKDDRKRTMIQKWVEAEAKCAETNVKVANGAISADSELITLARSYIVELLGDAPPLRELIRLGDHGPGSTTSSEGNKVCQYYKYREAPYHVTRSAWKYAAHAIWTCRQWRRAVLKDQRSKVRFDFRKNPLSAKIAVLDQFMTVVSGSKFSSVPKDAKTDRPINIEPDMNLYLQKGVGAYIRRCLKDVGVDLDMGQTMNRALANWGSRFFRTPFKSFATIDLSAASDSLATSIVQLLLPTLWFAYLDDIRSKTVSIPGRDEVHYLKKFSAMGNGFTFELESLIFWALSKAACVLEGREPVVTVYGDDIIVPALAARPVMDALEYCGFTVNQEKSFWEGPFRESCGADYHDGVNVRPYYQKKELNDVRQLFVLANSCYIRGDRHGIAWGKYRTSILGRVPRAFASIRGPLCESLDTHIFDDLPPPDRGELVYWNVLPRDYFDQKSKPEEGSSKRNRVTRSRSDRRRLRSRIEPIGGQIIYKTLSVTPRKFHGHSWFRYIDVLRNGRVTPVTRRDDNIIKVERRLSSWEAWNNPPVTIM